MTAGRQVGERDNADSAEYSRGIRGKRPMPAGTVADFGWGVRGGEGRIAKETLPSRTALPAAPN